MPSLLAQPKLKVGVPLPAGVTCNCTLASATLPPVAQAPTAQVAGWPASTLACNGMISTHRLTDCAVRAVSAAVCVPAALADPLDGEDEADDDEAEGEVTLGEAAGCDVVGEPAEALGAGVVVLGDAVGLLGGDGEDVPGDGDALLVVGEDVGEGDVDEALGDGDGEALPDGVAVGEALVLDADGLGDAVAACRGWHDWAAAGDALTAAAAVPAVAATVPAASTALPAAAVSDVRSARARGISGPHRDRYWSGATHRHGEPHR